METVCANDFREERRRLDWVRKELSKKRAYDKAFERLQSMADAA